MSSFGKLNSADFWKALAVIVITAVLGAVEQALSKYGLSFASYDWGGILNLAVTAGVGYLVKNLVSDSSGAVLGVVGGVK